MGADNMIVVVPTVVNGVPGWVVAYFQGVSHCRMYSYGWFMEIVKSVWKWAECREDAERLAESMSDPYLSYGIKWHPGFPGDPGITVGNDGRVVWTAEQERAVQQEEKGGGWGDYDRLPRNGITPRERALALADGGSRARLYTERFPPHDASPYHCTLWEADKADVARNNRPTTSGFRTREHWWDAPSVSSRESVASYLCHGMLTCGCTFR